MKFKRLVLSVLTTSILVGAPLSYAAKPCDRLEQRMKYRSNLSCEAVNGSGKFTEGRIDEVCPDGVDYNDKDAYNKALIHLTAMQCDVLRDVAYGWKLSEITSKTYIQNPDVEVPTESDPSVGIIHQKDRPELNGKTSVQLAHDWEEEHGETTAALVCANAQYKLGRVDDSSSQEEGVAQQSVNLIDYMTTPNEMLNVYYGNGRSDEYNAENSMVMNKVTCFKDKCLPAVSDFRCGVCKELRENPNGLSKEDLVETNLLFHAAADKDQVAQNGGQAYFDKEFEHIFKVCDKEKIKCVVMSKFGTGSFAGDRKVAEAAWDNALKETYEKFGKKLGIRVIVADGAPKADKPADKNAFIKAQKEITKKMLRLITRKSPVAGAKVEGLWGI